MTNIAVACTADGLISSHFPRSTHFQVFSVEDGAIRAVTTENVSPVLEILGKHQPHGSAGHEGHGRHHNHDDVLGALGGCTVVLCGGMGAGIAGTLSGHSIEPIVVAGVYTPEEAVDAYVRGDLKTGAIHACCGHTQHA